MADLLAFHDVDRRFTEKLDVAAKLLNLFGARYRERSVHAVDHVDLAIQRGEIVALVGESGCGKSTLGRIASGILQPSGGHVAYEGTPVAELSGEARQDWVRRVQMIFQDPMTALNPRKSVFNIIAEAPIAHGLLKPAQASARVAELLESVGLDTSFSSRVPHELSGGQRQRVGIARALAVNPALLVCDEATAALDVSVQAQILNMFLELKEKFDLTYLFISHNLGAVRHVADRIVIMYLGRIVEVADAKTLFEAPQHPYTRALLQQAPRLERHRAFEPIKGEIPSPIDPPTGCHFHPRCPYALETCRKQKPPLIETTRGHLSACHRVQDGSLSAATSPIESSSL